MTQDAIFTFAVRGFPPFPLEVTDLKVTQEGINEDYCAAIILKTQRELPVKLLLGKEAFLQFSWNHQQGYVRGLIHGVKESWRIHHWEYVLTLRAPLTQLYYQSHQRVFVEKTIGDILEIVLKELPLAQKDIQLNEKDILCPFIPQHNESDYDFFRRLVERYALLYCYRYDESGLTLIIRDDIRALPGNDVECILGEGEGFFAPKKAFFHVSERVYLHHNECKKQLNVHCDDMSLQIGDIVTLTSKGAYRIIHKDQRLSQSSGLLFNSDKKQKAYSQRLTLIPLEQPFIRTDKKPQQYSHSVMASIASPNTKPYLDGRGCYRAQFHFDGETQNPLKGSSPLAKVQFFGGEGSTGFHFPLPPKSSCVVGFLQSNGESPVILGVLPTFLNPSTVTSANVTQGSWRTRGGNELLFNESNDNPYLSLHTFKKSQEIALFEEKSKRQIVLNNKTGTIKFSAKSAWNIKNGGSENTLINKTHRIDTQGDFSFMSQQGTLKWVAGAEIHVGSQKNLELFLSKNLNVLSEGGVFFQTESDFNLDILNGSAKVNAMKGQVVLSSEGNLSLESSQGDILLQNSKGFIKLSKDGILTVKGYSLTFKAENIYIKNATWIN